MLQILWKHDSFKLIVILHFTVLYNKGIFNKAALKKLFDNLTPTPTSRKLLTECMPREDKKILNPLLITFAHSLPTSYSGDHKGRWHDAIDLNGR